MNTRWRGSKALTESPESPQFAVSGGKYQITRIFTGPHNVCLSNMPDRGTGISGYSGYAVDAANVTKRPGGMGRLTVVATMEAPPVPPNSTTDLPQVKYEIVWQRIERPLITHPIFWYDGGLAGQGGQSPTGPHALWPENKFAIEQWEKETDYTLKINFQYKKAGITTDLTNAEIFYCRKRMQGEESYIMFAPIARKTTLIRKLPPKTNCAIIGTPTGFGTDLPAPYVWLKTADESTRTGSHGKWERREEWTGAHYWDTDFYTRAWP